MELRGTNDTVEVTDALGREGADDEQMGRWSLLMAFYGIASAMFMLYIGAAMAVAYGTADALIGLALTIIVYSLINRVLAKHSIRNRTTVARFSRTILGKAGTVIAAIILALTAIYYAVFEGEIVVYAFQSAFGGEKWIWSLVVVAYSTPLILGGVRRFLDKLNGWLLPLYLIGLAVMVIWAGVRYGFSDTWLTQTPGPELPLASGGPGWLATFSAYLGVWVLMMYVMDFAALGKRKDVKFHSRYTFTWPFWLITYGLNALVGIFLTFTIPGLEVSESGLSGGLVALMGPVGLIIILVFQTRINTANYYIGAANVQEFGERLFRVKLPAFVWVIVSSVIIYALMLLPIIQYLLIALAWQGVLVSGWVAIALTHILLTRSRQESGLLGDEHYRHVHAPGLIAWVAATVIGLFLTSAFPWGATWGPIATVVVASGLYAALRPLFQHQSALRS
ncbi:permease [Herbiconiux sp.]|uniref:purine-cytosine permease family protein n=1 Tax=Herbiconiux sp. TaxID=1871186 RepID=UPI0025BEB06D|nr:permease [Herbiconiux sp.]